jgi:hypothetical protein
VSREDIVWIGLAIALLIGGLWVGRRFVSPQPIAQGAQEIQGLEGGAGSFRQWFWEKRGLDLAVQVGLILGGALGIAALLPRGREDEEG